jgi:hypothetical protein
MVEDASQSILFSMLGLFFCHQDRGAAGYSETEFAKQHCHISEDSDVLFVTAVRTLDLVYR